MLFQHNPPLFIKQIAANRLILLTKFRIIYSLIDKPSQLFYSILVEKNPSNLEYSFQRQEALVVTQKSLEIYTCDFFSEVVLKKVIILNDEIVYSVLRSNLKEWQVFGQIYQYSTKNVQIHSIQLKSVQQEALSYCFVEQFEIYVGKNKSIRIYDHKGQIGQKLKWTPQTTQIQTYLNNLKTTELKLKANKLHFPKISLKPAFSTIKQSKSQNYQTQKQEITKKQQNPFTHKHSGSQIYLHSVVSQSCAGSYNLQESFVLSLEIDSRFVLVLIPPQRQHSGKIRKESSLMSLKSCGKYVEPVASTRYEKRWQMRKLNIFPTTAHILYTSTFRHFPNLSILKTQQMIRTNLLSDKQSKSETDLSEKLWKISGINKGLLFSFLKLEQIQNMKNQQQLKNQQEKLNLFMDQNTSKSLVVENYLIPQKNLFTSNGELNLEYEFVQYVKSLQEQNNRRLNPVIELIEVDKSPKDNSVDLSFLYFDQLNKAKTLTFIKLKAVKMIDDRSKNFENSTKNTKITSVREHIQMQGSQKIAMMNPPVLSQNMGLNSSESLSSITPISGSQPINLTYSEETQLTKTQILSKIPSTQSQREKKIDYAQQKPLAESMNQKHSTPLSESSPETMINPLKQSRNRSQISSSPQKIPPETKQFMSQIQQVTELRLPSRTHLQPIPINEVSEYHEDSKFNQEEEIQSIEQVMEIVDFARPISHDRSFGVGLSAKSITNSRSLSKNHSDLSQKVVEKLQFDDQTQKKLILVNKESFGIINNNKLPIGSTPSQDPLLSKIKSSPNKSTPKPPSGLDYSLQNQTQEKQFYQKFINDFDQKNQDNLSQTNFINLKQSRDSIDKGFKISKITSQELTKKQNMHNMIGKDISQIVNGKHLEMNTDEDLSEETIQLGEEIEKEYSRTEMRKWNSNKQGILRQPSGQGLFSKHSASVSYSEPTVILLDKLDTSSQKQNNSRSQHSAEIDQTNPNTPGFNFEFHQFDNDHSPKQPQIGIVKNDHWGNFSRKWNMTANQQYNETEEFNLKDSRVSSLKDRESQKSQKNNLLLTQKQLQNVSRKVKAFCINFQKLTYNQVRQIQSKKYTQLMRQIFIRSQQQFNILMRQFLQQIICQQQARLFFAEYIRTFSGKTRDILVRLYMSLPDTDQNRRYMTRALSQFKLSEVPEICLTVQRDTLPIFKLLYPSVFVEDLLKPSIHLYQKLLENYFALQRLPIDQIIIQDEAIDLSHPRNMLNILLYLNELYNLPMTQLFEVYCTQLIKNDCSQIIVKMLKEQQTFEICQVNKAMLEDIIEHTIIEKLKESSANIQWIGRSLEIFDCGLSSLSVKKKTHLSIILNVIDMLNLTDCYFSIDMLFKLAEIKNLFVFCNTLIRQNETENLKKLNFPNIYKELHQIAYEQKLKYYNQQLKDLMEILCEKYFQNQCSRMAFSIIAPMVAIIKRGFIAKMLFRYMEGKLINRLANKTFTKKSEFIGTFKEFFTSVSQSQRMTKQPAIQHDTFEFDSSKSYLMNCPYFKFYGMYSDCVHSTHCQEVIFICYTDYQLASQLASYHVLDKKEWQDLSEALNQYVPKEEIKKLVAKSVFKFNSSVMVGDEENDIEENEPKFQPSSSFMMKQSLLLNVDKSEEEKKHIKSLQAIEFQEINKKQIYAKKLNIPRSKSDVKAPEQMQKSKQNKSPDDSIIQSLKYQVDPQSIKSTLKHLYNKKSPSRSKNFLKALSIIDRQRFNLCHYEKFKTIINLQLDFEIQNILPFQFFFTPDYETCFQIIKQNDLRKKLSIKNFWTVYIVLELMLSKGENVAMMMIQKLLSQNSGEGVAKIVEQIFDKCRLTQQNLMLLAATAEMQGETQVVQKIKQRILQKSN